MVKIGVFRMIYDAARGGLRHSLFIIWSAVGTFNYPGI